MLFFGYPDLPIRFLFCPFLYLYVVNYLNPSYKPSGLILLLLFLPEVIELLVYSGYCFYFMFHHYPPEKRLSMISSNFLIARSSSAILFNLAVIIGAYRQLSNFSRNIYRVSSNLSLLNLQWVKAILNIALFVLFFWTALFIIQISSGKVNEPATAFFPLYVAIALILLGFGYASVLKLYMPFYYRPMEFASSERNINVLTDIAEIEKSEAEIAKAPALFLEDPDEEDEAMNHELLLLFEKLEVLLEKEKLYKDSDLSLSTLVNKLNTTSFNISQAIKLHSRQGNFYKYINTHRLKYFITLLQNEENNIYTLHTIGQMAGFNSKTTFNKYCIEITGLSPAILKAKITAGFSVDEILNSQN